MNTMTAIATASEVTPSLLGNMTFNAFVDDVHDKNGKTINPNIARGVYRDDTNELIATCGKSFTPVQHHEIMDPITQFLSDAGYDLEHRKSTRRSLYDLAGKKGAFIQPRFTENGAIMRTDIYTGDFIRPTGSSSYLEQGPDTLLFKISVLNSHNSTYAVRVITSYERLICMNGMTKPDFSAGIYGKHTQGFNLSAMTSQIENAIAGMTQDADTFGRWAKKRITVEVAEVILQKTLAKLPNKPNGKEHFSETLVNKVLERFRFEDQTVWGLFQAVTWWQSHSTHQKNSDPVKTLIKRESRVSKMLRSQTWQIATA